MQENTFEDIYYRTNVFETRRLTLVFIHGVSGSSSAWLPYEKKFENKYNVLTYDIRGHGLSKKYPHYVDYEVKNYVADLESLLTHLNLKKFILISNSFGGLIHLEYLKSHGEAVLGNVFTSPEVYLDKEPLAKIVRPTLTLIKNILKIMPANLSPRGHVDYRKYIGSTDWSIGRNLADMRNTGLRAHFFTLRQSVNQNQEYGLDKINVPTLVMHGEKDTMVPLRNALAMSQKIKNSEFVSIPNIDHNTAHNAVLQMSEVIASFIEKKNLLQY